MSEENNGMSGGNSDGDGSAVKVGKKGQAIDAQRGRVLIEGESWKAVSETPVAAGQCVEILDREGLTLKVKPRE